MSDEIKAPTSQKKHVISYQGEPGAIGSLVSVDIDGVHLSIPFGTTILDAAKKIGIKIPTLCHHPDLCIAGVCRICVVEVEGQRTLQASCAYPITGPLTIKTHTSKVRQARKHILDLLLSNHLGECYTCVRNGKCELQNLAQEYGVDHYRFGKRKSAAQAVDASSYSVVRDMSKCILCRRCVRTCMDLQGVGALEAIGRGSALEIQTYLNKPLLEVVCINCGQCINRCPTGALHTKDPSDEIWKMMDDPNKHVVIQTAPSPRAGIGECFDLPPGKCLTYEMNTALRLCGFDKVFDTNFSADLTIIEEATELLYRLKKALVDKESVSFPQFTSCSPGWVKYVEHYYPQYIPNLSTAKSPQQMFGAVIKTYYAQMHKINPEDIVTVALMPCSAKKFECNRPEMISSGYKDVDYGLTTRELAQMMKEIGIYLPNMQKSSFDDPFGDVTGSGIIFGTTGGVMEAALRTALEFVSGVLVENLFENADILPVRGFAGIRYFELPIPTVNEKVPEILKNLFQNFDFLKGVTLKVAVVHGTENAKKVLEDIASGGPLSQCHFIEFMACPGGCIGGGGQPIPTNLEIRKARMQAIYAEDRAAKVRKSHENPAIIKLYQDFFKEGPCGKYAHELLHTHYTIRDKYIG